MIKGVATHHGKPLLVLGLSHRNTQRLHEGKPILVMAAQLGLPDIAVALCAGPTEEQLAAQLEREIPNLDVHQDALNEERVRELVRLADEVLSMLPASESKAALASAVAALA